MFVLHLDWCDPIYRMFTGQHFRPTQLAKLWGFSADTMRAWFKDEAGVLVEDKPEQMHKRGYRSIRIPASVARRVYEEHISR